MDMRTLVREQVEATPVSTAEGQAKAPKAQLVASCARDIYAASLFGVKSSSPAWQQDAPADGAVLAVGGDNDKDEKMPHR